MLFKHGDGRRVGGLKVRHRPFPEETSLLASPLFGLALKACLKLETEFVISRGKKKSVFLAILNDQKILDY